MVNHEGSCMKKYFFILLCCLLVGVLGFLHVWHISARCQAVPMHKPVRPMFEPKAKNNVQMGIFSHQVYSASSKDSLTWTLDNQLLFDHASVPDAVITKDGTIFLYFMDASKGHGMSVAKSQDLGKTWQKFKVEIENKKGEGDAVDPNPILLEDGTIRLFYFGTFGPAQAEPERSHDINSALSKDGIHFVEEDGVRFSAKGITDPDVIKTKTGWKMFVSFGRQNISLSSKDGMTFTHDLKNASYDGSVSRTIAVDGGYRMYKCGDGGIVSQFTRDFETWQQEGIRIQAKSGEMVCDPGIIPLPDGTYKMFYKVVPAQ